MTEEGNSDKEIGLGGDESGSDPSPSWSDKSSGDAKGSQNETTHQRHEVKYTLFMGAAVLAAIVVILFFWIQAQRSRTQESATGEATHVSVPPQQVLGAFAAMELVAKALVVNSQEGLERFYHLGSVNAEEALAFIEQLELPPSAEIRLEWVGGGHGLKAYEGVTVKWRQDGQMKYRLAPLLPDDRGVWKIDYEAFACYNKPAWEKLLKGDEVYGMVRAVFRKDNYFNGPYNEDGWSCYRLRTVDSEKVIYGYARKNSAQAMALESIQSTNLPNAPAANVSEGLISTEMHNSPVDGEDQNPATRCIFEIRKNEGSLPGQFEIVRVLASDWVMEDQIFDERFKGLEEGAGAGEPGQ